MSNLSEFDKAIIRKLDVNEFDRSILQSLGIKTNREIILESLISLGIPNEAIEFGKRRVMVKKVVTEDDYNNFKEERHSTLKLIISGKYTIVRFCYCVEFGKMDEIGFKNFYF